MLDAGIICVLGGLLIWKFYQYRKAIWHNMNLYGDYISNLMKAKEDEINKRKQGKNERR